MENIPQGFGASVFNDAVMREILPKDTYRVLKKTITDGSALDASVANVVAAAMKDWAVQKGATHFTHWFQPMTGITAEKHDSFIAPSYNDGVIMEFSGKELIKGESDASSFPSGGLRATFEARGYTAWDPSSYAFIKDNTLYIPTAFCSYGGEALDKKTPLLRSMEALNTEALRLLKLFGVNAGRVYPTVGAEQEYFLIDEKHYRARRDLRFTGRTLLGARPPKGQELDDHYFGTIKERVKKYMRDLDRELWSLGIHAKTEHNEAAPAQHELACIYASANVATDQNQLVMDIMKKVARRHGLVCLLHEKPFAGVSGSGKHNNWSLSTDTGLNLLDPGKHPSENTLFLLILAAVVKAVDLHQDLLRISVATASNDCRLGTSEAPPPIISVYLGDGLLSCLEGAAKDEVRVNFKAGVDILPQFRKDTADRNRTSPFAYTGKKFEFRMPGSSSSVASPNLVLNTAVADVFAEMADRLESELGMGKSIEAAARELISKTVEQHRRIIFNGNNYSDEWAKEAAERGLLILPRTTDALAYMCSEKNIDLFARRRVFSETELRSRLDIYYENYRKTVKIEGYTMLEIVNKDVLPAAVAFAKELSDEISSVTNVLDVECAYERKTLAAVKKLTEDIAKRRDNLKYELERTRSVSVASVKAEYYAEKVRGAMESLRVSCDDLETLLPERHLPYPSYGTILFGVE